MALRGLQADALEHFKRAIGFVKIGDLYNRGLSAHCMRPMCRIQTL